MFLAVPALALRSRSPRPARAQLGKAIVGVSFLACFLMGGSVVSAVSVDHFNEAVESLQGQTNGDTGGTFEDLQVQSPKLHLRGGTDGDEENPRCNLDKCPARDDSCTDNSDCRTTARMKDCNTYRGYCLNNPDTKSSEHCSGTCVDKLDDGADCSTTALNINDLDSSGDDRACSSRKCICGKCALISSSNEAGTRKVGLEFVCSEKKDCTSDWCQGPATANCSGFCHRKRDQGEKCYLGDPDSCTSGRCSGLTGGNECLGPPDALEES